MEHVSNLEVNKYVNAEQLCSQVPKSSKASNPNPNPSTKLLTVTPTLQDS